MQFRPWGLAIRPQGGEVGLAAAILEVILGEADALIRQPLKDRGLELPHLVIAVTPHGE